MVGDWVRVNRDGLCIKNSTIVKVLGVEGESKLKEKGLIGYAGCQPLDKEQFCGGIWLDYLAPIPITPEILEKNGFTYCKSDGGVYLHTTISYGNWDVDVVLFDVTDEYRNNQLHISSPDDSYIAIHLMECNHVHELQHALRLCGIKKEISLC